MQLENAKNKMLIADLQQKLLIFEKNEKNQNKFKETFEILFENKLVNKLFQCYPEQNINEVLN